MSLYMEVRVIIYKSTPSKLTSLKPYFEKPMIKENRKPLHVIHIRQNERERFLSLINPVSKRSGKCGGNS